MRPENKIRARLTDGFRSFRRLGRLAATALAVIALAGCSPSTKFRVVEAPPPVMTGTDAINGRAMVVNDSGRDLMVESAHIVLRYRGRELGRARLLLPVAVPVGGPTAVRYDFALEGLTAGTVRALGVRLLANPDAVTADVTARVRWGALRKNIDLKDVPATRLMALIAP